VIDEFALQCPMPLTDNPTIQMGHGGGGRMTRDLVEKVFLPVFGNDLLAPLHDGAILPPPGGRLAFTTDSFVVRPLFFRGGDIGTLAVNGTVNDLAMCGARPLYLSAGFLLEEGLPIKDLWRVVRSMGAAAAAAGVRIVTGDTKVVDRGHGDGLFINTAGVGVIETPLTVGPRSVRVGDSIVLNGDLGRHGIAVMAEREGLQFESEISSDCAPLYGPVRSLLEGGIEVHCLRDLTRGGLTAALVEISESARLPMRVEEEAVAVRDEVRGACEILGLEPFSVANEGRFVAFVPARQAEAARRLLGPEASVIGSVEPPGSSPPMVEVRTSLGTTRLLDLPSGEQLPRIC
jgi:hydrogenase expression/formation protein HypE